MPGHRHGLLGGRARHRGSLDRLRGARRDQFRPRARRRAEDRHHHLQRDPAERPAGGDRPRGRGRGVPRPPDALHVRLPELHLGADPPSRRPVLRDAVRHRSEAGAREHAGDDRHLQAVRRPDRVSSRCAGAPRRQRSRAAGRAADGGAPGAVHRRARPRSAQSAGVDRRRRQDAGTHAARRQGDDDRGAHARKRRPYGRAHQQRAGFRARAARRRHSGRAHARRQARGRAGAGGGRVALRLGRIA